MIKRLSDSYRILQKSGSNISTFGEGSTSGKYIRLYSSISKVGTNRFTCTVALSTSSGAVYNGYGVRIYAVVAGSRTLLGTTFISGGSCSPSSFSHTFNISKTSSVYATSICAYCEDGIHSDDRDKFVNQTSPDTATYINPDSSPSTPRISCSNATANGNYYGEGTINLALTNSVDPDGKPVTYRIYAEKFINGAWIKWNGSSDLITAAQSVNASITGDPRGTRYRVWGYSYDGTLWSGKSNIIDNIYRNHAPSTPNMSTDAGVSGGNYVVESTVGVSLSTVSDNEGHGLNYRIYGQYAPPGHGWSSLGDGNNFVHGGQSLSFNVSGHARGTRFKFWGLVTDSLGARSGESNVIDNIYRNREPSTPSMSCSSTAIGNNYVTESNINVALSTVSDPDGHSIVYHMYGQYAPPGQGWISLGDGNSYLGQHKTRSLDITGHARGTRFRFWGAASDSFGIWSAQSNTVDNIYRNREPSTPSMSCSSTAIGNNYVTESNINVALSTVSDPDGHSIVYHMYGQYAPPGQGWITLGDSNNYLGQIRTKSLDITGYARGTRFKFWGAASDSLGAWSAQSNVMDNIYRNHAPNTPSMSCSSTAIGNNYVTESNINVALSTVSDPDGHAITYHMYGQYAPPGQGWISLGDGNSYLGQHKTKSLDITGHARGTRFKFWGAASDSLGAWSAQSNVIENIRRNQVPNTPSMSCSNGVVSGTHIVENALNVALSTVSDPDGHAITYHMYGQYASPGGNWTTLGDSSNYLGQHKTKSLDITGHARGTRFKFWGAASDSLGAWSAQSNVIENIRRNQVPNTISIINPTARIITGNTIDLSWSNPGDPDGQSLTYNISVSKDNGSFVSISTGHASNSYSYNVSNDPPATIYIFKINANDGIVNGSDCTSPRYRKNFPPVYGYPRNNTTLYNMRPRIIVRKLSKNDIFLCVNCNGVVYNARDNANMFSGNGVSEGNEQYHVFKTNNMSVGNNNITVYCSDGILDSTSVNASLNIERLEDSVIDNSITKRTFDILNTASSSVCVGYTGITSNIVNIVSGQTVVKYSDSLDKLKFKMAETINMLNRYDSNRITLSWSTANTGTIVNKIDVKQVLDYIRTI